MPINMKMKKDIEINYKLYIYVHTSLCTPNVFNIHTYITILYTHMCTYMYTYSTPIHNSTQERMRMRDYKMIILEYLVEKGLDIGARVIAGQSHRVKADLLQDQFQGILHLVGNVVSWGRGGSLAITLFLM